MSNITLHVRTDVPPMSFEAFCAATEPYSIAADGYVKGGPRFRRKGPYASFNHHEEVDRLGTRATCAQVLMAIRQGLFTCFRDNEGHRAQVFVNDCDEDVATAWTLLKHHYLAESAMNPALNRLVSMEDSLDCTAGAYPFPPDLPALRELAWVFEPYRQFRMSGQLGKRDAKAYSSVITDVEHRILQHIAGRGHEVPLDTRYERIGGGRGWVLVREIGAQARTGMFADGIRVFASLTDRPDDRFGWVIGKMSSFMPVDMPALAARLNQEEGITDQDTWGGADNVIGSPRVRGSGIDPDRLAHLMDQACTD